LQHDHDLPFIVDANVLIDYCDSDLNMLSLVSQKVSAIHVSRSTLNKIGQLSEAQADKYNLVIQTPDLKTALEASKERGRLAKDDRETLLLAKEHGWTCITNDKALRRECEKDGVKVLWGLEPMKILIKQKLITSAKAIKIARLIRLNNSAYITQEILAKFEAEVKDIS
jgi:rRNA-processing protein FCF1